MSKIVAVCGATGQQGGGTLSALLRMGGFSIRALTRDPASKASQALSSKGAEVVKADFDNLESLKVAFEGADAVFGVTDFWKGCGLDPHREKAQGHNIVDAAKAAGVKHVVWSTLEDTRPHSKGILEPVTGDYTVPHFDVKAEIEAYLAEQMPNAYTCVLPSAFYENLLPGKDMPPIKQDDGSFIIVLPVADAKLAWCSTPDIGNVAAAVIAGGPDKFGGKTVPVVGEHLTWAEVAGKLARVTGKQVIAVTPPPDAWVEQLKGYGAPEIAAKDLANMCTFYVKVGMLENRKLEDCKAVYSNVQDLESWLLDKKEVLLSGMA